MAKNLFVQVKSLMSHFTSSFEPIATTYRRVRRELHRTEKWKLPYDNAPAHSVIRVRQFLAQKIVAMLDHPLYSPDLSPSDFFLFPRLKADIKGEKVHV